jgi:hypothetical protein
MIEIETVAISKWLVEEDKFFTVYHNEWAEFMDDDIESATEGDRKEFVKETVYLVSPYFDELGAEEVLDAYEVNVNY